MATPSSGSPASGRVFQSSLYIGMIIAEILYGIELLLCFKTIRILLTGGGMSKRSNVVYASFSIMMVFSVTVWIATQSIFNEKMWLVDAGYPGGHSAYWNANISVWYVDCGTTTVVLLQLMTDALMIYRCWAVWNCRRVIVMPIVLWVATLVLGVLVDWTSSSPGGDWFAGQAAQFVVVYYIVSVVLHASLTCMICYRVLQHGRAVRARLGREFATIYFSVASAVVESVLPYTVSGIAFVVSMGIGSPTSVGFVCVYIMMMCISPQMLILRVVAGKAWDQDTFRLSGSAIKFDAGDTQGFDSREATSQLRTLSMRLPDGSDNV